MDRHRNHGASGGCREWRAPVEKWGAGDGSAQPVAKGAAGCGTGEDEGSHQHQAGGVALDRQVPFLAEEHGHEGIAEEVTDHETGEGADYHRNNHEGHVPGSGNGRKKRAAARLAIEILRETRIAAHPARHAPRQAYINSGASGKPQAKVPDGRVLERGGAAEGWLAPVSTRLARTAARVSASNSATTCQKRSGLRS